MKNWTRYRDARSLAELQKMRRQDIKHIDAQHRIAIMEIDKAYAKRIENMTKAIDKENTMNTKQIREAINIVKDDYRKFSVLYNVVPLSAPEKLRKAVDNFAVTAWYNKPTMKWEANKLLKLLGEYDETN